MKKNFIKSFLFAAAVVTMTFTACSSDVENFNTPNDNDIEIPKGKTLFSSGDMTGMPVINADADGEAKAMLLNGDGTRTSMGGKAVNKKFPFYWEPGDRIWVNNGNYRRSSSPNITATQPKAQFMLDGTPPFTASRYEVFYVGQNSPQAASETANALQVTIADQQTQSGWNNSKHIGTSGDCGTGYANLQNNGSYTFTIDHKASYLIFYPYLHTALVSNNNSYTLQKIEIYSDAGGSSIAGTYDFSFANGLSDIPQAGTAKQQITLTCGNAFDLNTFVPDLTDNNKTFNHCFVVIAPGTHTLTIRYTVKNASGTEFQIIKDISSKVYAENSVYTFIHEMRYFEMESTMIFNETNFKYQWGLTMPQEDPNFVRSNYNNATTPVTTGFWSTIPTYTQAQMYYAAGVYYDNSITWKYNLVDGRQATMRGGWWLKKKAYISGFAAETAPKAANVSTQTGRPDASVINQYFFMPAWMGIGNYNLFWINWPSSASIAMVAQFTTGKAGEAIFSKHNSLAAGYRPATGNADGSSNTLWWQ